MSKEKIWELNCFIIVYVLILVGIIYIGMSYEYVGCVFIFMSVFFFRVGKWLVEFKDLINSSFLKSEDW